MVPNIFIYFIGKVKISHIPNTISEYVQSSNAHKVTIHYRGGPNIPLDRNLDKILTSWIVVGLQPLPTIQLK